MNGRAGRAGNRSYFMEVIEVQNHSAAPAPTREFLNHWGARLCRPCHSAVHRVADNTRLAAELPTLDKLRDDPDVARWVAYARTQRRPLCH